MAVLAAAQLLDELMGRHRNINPNEKIKKPNWEDSEYCKYYMVMFCPHDLFVNTRADLGACPKVHDDEVKELFNKAESSYKKTQYIEEFLRFCQHMINDVERKIQKGKQRLALMNTKPEGPPMTLAQTEKNQEQVLMLSEKVASLVEEAEEAGTRGDVEQAQGLMKLCDRLKEEKDTLLKQQENSHWSMTAELAAAQEKQMEVCPVCGAFLIVGDAQQRIDDHLSGKQHVGYSKLRQAYEEMLATRDKELEEKERKRKEKRAKERGDREGRGDRSSRGGLGSDRGGLGSDRGGLGSDRGGLGSDRGGLGSDRGGLGSDRGGLGSDRGGLGSDRRDRDRGRSSRESREERDKGDKDKEKDKEREKDNDKEPEKDREREKTRERERDRDRDRERDRDRRHRRDRRGSSRSRDRSRRRSRDRR